MTTPNAVATRPLYEVQESRLNKGDWVVEMIDRADEGQVECSLFSGRWARERAEEYAGWKNSGGAFIG